ncbi:MAG: pyrroline-5-carboxylate reductase [Lysobacteraceae bacterium]
MPSSESRVTSPTTTIAFIGGGNMARSLIGGLIARGTLPASLRVSEPSEAVRAGLTADFGVAVFTDNAEAVRGTELAVFAVKPQVMKPVCEALVTTFPGNAVALSIAAGITSAQIDQWLGGGRAVVRTMPNTPALLGAGATGLFANARTDAGQRALAQATMDAVGVTAWIDDETLMDTVTAVSGSGPAYFFLLAEALQAAAIAQGLPPDAARALVVQTCAGAGRMLAESGEDAATLRQRVTSPGGTTQAALESFAASDFAGIVANAVAAATQRGAELAAKAGG